MTDHPTFTDEYVEQVRAAEAAAQRSVILTPDGRDFLPEDVVPDRIAAALERRVEVNLAQADGKTVTRVGGADPEVRDLEAPFSRRIAPEPVDPAPQTRGSHRRRVTKAAAKKAATSKENS